MWQSFGIAFVQVLGLGLVVGAGLPAIFAIGVRALAYGAGGDAEVDHAPGKPIGTVLAYTLFAIVALVILTGLAIIISSGFGYTVSFEHIFPTFIKKGH